jgi:hypothetical protein
MFYGACSTVLNESCEAQNMSETPAFDDFDEAHGYKRFGFGASLPSTRLPDRTLQKSNFDMGPR